MQNPQPENIFKAQVGDEQELAAIITNFMPLIRAVAYRNVCVGLEYDDLVQESLIALFNTIKSYNPSKGASFSTYAKICVENAAISAVRGANRQKHSLLTTALPLSEIENTQTSNSPEDLLLQSETYNNTLTDIATRLSQNEREVLTAFLDGKPYSEIAQKLNISEKAVGNALQRARAKLR